MNRLADSARERALALPLPVYRHVPGSNARHDDRLLEQVCDMALAVTRDADWQDNVAWLYGLRLLDEGFHWEAHEVLERVWMNAPPNSREPHLVQGIVQLANARLKACDGREKAALRLLAIAGECLERAFGGNVASVMGIDAGSVAGIMDAARMGEKSSICRNMQNNA